MDTLSRRDYEELVGILKPALEKARKTVTGKQIQSVSSNAYAQAMHSANKGCVRLKRSCTVSTAQIALPTLLQLRVHQT